MKYILNNNKFKKINEGLLKKMFSFAKELYKMGKVKKVISQYNKEYPKLYKEKVSKQLEIKINEKLDKDVDSLKEELEIINEELELLKEDLDNEIENIIKKDSGLKLKAQRLKLKTKKDLLPELRKVLEDLSKEGKYKEYKNVIEKRIKETEKAEQKISNSIKEIKKQMNKYNRIKIIWDDKNGDEKYLEFTQIEDKDNNFYKLINTNSTDTIFEDYEDNDIIINLEDKIAEIESKIRLEKEKFQKSPEKNYTTGNIKQIIVNNKEVQKYKF